MGRRGLLCVRHMRCACARVLVWQLLVHWRGVAQDQLYESSYGQTFFAYELVHVASWAALVVLHSLPSSLFSASLPLVGPDTRAPGLAKPQNCLFFGHRRMHSARSMTYHHAGHNRHCHDGLQHANVELPDRVRCSGPPLPPPSLRDMLAVHLSHA